jgi:sulfur carrier protein
MKLKINNSLYDFAAPLSVSNLLKNMNLDGKPVVIELNQEAIFPRNYDTTIVDDGDSLEIVTIAAGG